MAKKYFVSLAVSVPHNYEGEVEAESKDEAIKKALEFFPNLSGFEMNSFDGCYDEARLKSGFTASEMEESENLEDFSGVYITEIKNNK